MSDDNLLPFSFPAVQRKKITAALIEAGSPVEDPEFSGATKPEFILVSNATHPAKEPARHVMPERGLG
jgi:hypothetical protein